MKLCFFSGDITRSGGTERVATQLANMLAKTGEYTVSILSLVEQEPQTFYPLEPSIEHTSLGRRWLQPGPGYLAVLPRLRKFLKKNQIDILIDIDVVLDCLSIPCARGLKTRVISWEHFHAEYESSVLYRRLITKYSVKRADYTIVLSNIDREDYGRIFHKRDNIQVIYNPMEPPTLEPLPMREREKWIVTAGRLTQIKGIDYLAQVAPIVLKANPDWKWIVLGEGEDRALLEEAIQSQGLEQQLILEGRVGDVYPYLQKSRLYVLTSRLEGLGMSILEAFSMGVPCVSFDVKAGPRELIRTGENGVLIPQFDCQAMGEEIVRLMNHEGLLEEMQEQTGRGLESLQPETVLEQWKQVFQYVTQL